MNANVKNLQAIDGFKSVTISIQNGRIDITAEPFHADVFDGNHIEHNQSDAPRRHSLATNFAPPVAPARPAINKVLVETEFSKTLRATLLRYKLTDTSLSGRKTATRIIHALEDAGMSTMDDLLLFRPEDLQGRKYFGETQMGIVLKLIEKFQAERDRGRGKQAN